MGWERMKKLPAESVARIVLYAMLVLIVVMFGLFYLVGYDQPFDEDPDYNAPRLSGALVSFTLSFVVLTIVAWLSAVIVSLKRRRQAGNIGSGVRQNRIALIVGAATLLILGVAFTIGSTSPLVVNNASFQSVFWLKTADMFIYSIVIMLLLASISLVFGLIRNKNGGER